MLFSLCFSLLRRVFFSVAKKLQFFSSLAFSKAHKSFKMTKMTKNDSKCII